jgi:light-regulated signal transduction histidine kinase (bacteriophytochrome)
MPFVDLLGLLSLLCKLHAQAMELARTGIPPVELLAQQQQVMAELTDRLHQQQERRAALAELVSDRINNVLMGVQTATDLLRHPPEEERCAELRQSLISTVDSGRDALRRIQAGLAELT